jgi:hypothetical protein
MGALDLAGTMDALAAAVEGTTAVTKCHAWPVEGAKVGEGVVGYPTESIEYDGTFQRGQDRATFPVWILCGLPSDQRTRTTLSALITGADSIKTAIEAYSTSAYDSVRVTDGAIDRFLGGSGEQVALRFDCDVIS